MTIVDTIQGSYQSLFGKQADLCLKANGRANIIGEHTDYHSGWVFPFAIDKGIVFCVSKSEKLTIYSQHFNEYFDGTDQVAGSWKSYVGNALRCIEERYAINININMVFGGDLPIGAGVSSSSALCCGMIRAIDLLYSLAIEPLEMVDLASQIEHGSGVIGGKMDQFTILFGQQDNALLLDCQKMTFENIVVPPSWSFILINSGVKHNLAHTAYNERRKDGESGLAILQQVLPSLESLRDLSKETLNMHQSLLSDQMHHRILHVLQENDRVLAFKHSMLEGDFNECGRLLNDSHQSLRDLYEVSCPELDTLQSLAMASGFISGARMMGGGFGGCTINLVRSMDVQALNLILKKFAHQYGYKPEVYSIHASAGMSLIHG